jgi:beta-1,4-glucosyltransferase
MNKTYTLAHIPITSTNPDVLSSMILSRADAHKKTILFYANTNFVVKCQSILPQLRDENVVVVNDGVGVDIGCWLIHSGKFEANLNGTDFTPYFFKQSPKKHRVFLIGSTAEVLDKAATHLKEQLGQDLAGMCDGFTGVRDANLIAQINASKADVVLVAMGNPLQEKWILDHYQKIDASVLMGVGALFDFWAGNKPRAPKLVQKLRLEWLFRLSLEPKRLFKRYTIDIFKFLYICIKNK